MSTPTATKTIDFSAGVFTRELWQAAAPILSKTEALPFLHELATGALSPERFVFYIVQDSLYLTGYAHAMSLLAAKAPSAPHTRFWAESVCGAIAAEQELHKDLLADPHLASACQTLSRLVQQPTPSPTTLGYTSYLVASAAQQPYEVGVAAVLPCFWVYAHVGKMLAAQAQAFAEGHPYQSWVACYDDAVFANATMQAVELLEQCAQTATPLQREAMRKAFLQACVYEWHFWHAAYEQQDWSLGR